MESETQTHDQSSPYLLSSVNWPLVIFQSYRTETYVAKIESRICQLLRKASGIQPREDNLFLAVNVFNMNPDVIKKVKRAKMHRLSSVAYVSRMYELLKDDLSKSCSIDQYFNSGSYINTKNSNFYESLSGYDNKMESKTQNNRNDFFFDSNYSGLTHKNNEQYAHNYINDIQNDQKTKEEIMLKVESELYEQSEAGYNRIVDGLSMNIVNYQSDTAKQYHEKSSTIMQSGIEFIHPSYNKFTQFVNIYLENPDYMYFARTTNLNTTLFLVNQTSQTEPITCLSGWARWCALSKLLENLQETKNNYKIKIPILVLQAEYLTFSEKILLSMYFNQSVKSHSVVSDVRGSLFADVLFYFSCIINEYISQGITNIVHITEKITSALFNELDFSLLKNMLFKLLCLNPANLSLKSFQDVILNFVRLLYFHECSKVINNENCQANCLVNWKDTKLSDLLVVFVYNCIPTNIQDNFNLNMFISLKKYIEIFFQPRSNDLLIKIANQISLSNEPISLSNYFLNQRETSKSFLQRLILSDKLTAIVSDKLVWSFDCLASFICFFNLHYLMEVDINCDDAILPSLQDIQTSESKIPLYCRVKFILRLVIIYLSLFYRNTKLFEIFQKYLDEKTKQSYFASDENYSDIYGPNYPDFIERISIYPQVFDLLLGVLSELIFRFILSGICQDEIFNFETLNTMMNDYRVAENFFAKFNTLFDSFIKCAAVYIELYLVNNNAILVHQDDSTMESISMVRISKCNFVSARIRVYEKICKIKHVKTSLFCLGYYDFHSLYYNSCINMDNSETLSFINKIYQEPDSILQALSQYLSKEVEPVQSDINTVINDNKQQDNEPSTECKVGDSHGLESRHVPNPEVQVRITHWFEECRIKAERVLAKLKLLDVQNINGNRASEQNANNFQDDANSNYTSENHYKNIQTQKYLHEIDDIHILPFAASALQAVRVEIESRFKWHLHENLKLIDTSSVYTNYIIISVRQVIIVILWQTLANLTPFFDITYATTCDWPKLRCKFAALLWKELRSELIKYCNLIAIEKSDLIDFTPQLKFCLQVLPVNSDVEPQSQLIDLTDERLEKIFSHSRLLERIVTAFYRFQCSGMTNATSTFGYTEAEQITVSTLKQILSNCDPCVEDLFISLWSSLPEDLNVEDAFYDNHFAAAVFLKKYGLYVLGCIEAQEFFLENQQYANNKLNLAESKYQHPFFEDINVNNTEEHDKLIAYEDEHVEHKGNSNIEANLNNLPAFMVAEEFDIESYLSSLPYIDRCRLETELPRNPCSKTVDFFLHSLINLSNSSKKAKLITNEKETLNNSLPILNDSYDTFSLFQLWPAIKNVEGTNMWRRPEPNILRNTDQIRVPQLTNLASTEIATINSVVNFLNLQGFSMLYHEHSNIFVSLEETKNLFSNFDEPNESFEVSEKIHDDKNLTRSFIFDYLNENVSFTKYCEMGQKHINDIGKLSDLIYVEKSLETFQLNNK